MWKGWLRTSPQIGKAWNGRSVSFCLSVSGMQPISNSGLRSSYVHVTPQDEVLDWSPLSTPLASTAMRCEVQVASASQRRARWNTRNVDSNSFSAAAEEAIELFSIAPLSLGDRVHRSNSVLLAAAKLHVGKSKTGRYTKPWSSPELPEAIKKRYALRRTVADNGDENLEACAASRKLSEESRQKNGRHSLPTQRTTLPRPAHGDISSRSVERLLKHHLRNLCYTRVEPSPPTEAKPTPSWRNTQRSTAYASTKMRGAASDSWNPRWNPRLQEKAAALP